MRPPYLPVLLLAGACGGPTPLPVATDAPGACCRELESLLEATLFGIDVARLRVRVDAETAVGVEALARSPGAGRAAPDAIAERYLAAERVEGEMTFLISMSGEQFLENTGETLRAMRLTGQLSPEEADDLAALSRRRFDFLVERGIRAGDRLANELSGDTVVTRFVGAEGELFSDRQVGSMHRRSVLGSWFAPGSDFRESLIELVLRRVG